MPAPHLEPRHRDPFEVAPTNSYSAKTPIWVYRHGNWRPGIIEVASAYAATVTYRPDDSYTMTVDTVTADELAARIDPDPLLDRPHETADGATPAITASLRQRRTPTSNP